MVPDALCLLGPMTLPTKAFLVMGLLLTSADAWAHQDPIVSIDGDGTVYTLSDQYRPAPRDALDHIRSTQGKRPVDVLSLSLGGALACFFALAMVRRRKSMKARVPNPKVNLPAARALTSGEPTDGTPGGD